MPANHDGWESIFAKLPIIKRVGTAGYFDITAEQIRTISNREARLMAKIDFREQLPPIMQEAGLGILAIANGTYRIGKFDPFIPISMETKVTPERIVFPSNIKTISPHDLAHESMLLDGALVSGLLSRVFGENVSLTIRGRSRSGPFSFTLNKLPFPVDGVQIEVDGGYEGPTTVNLVEAKIGARSNINVRQLIYPQLAWQRILNQEKTVRTFICFYQEPLIRFIPILFDNGQCRADHEHELVFTLEPEARLNLAAIAPRPDATTPVLGAPFPQADRFETVLAMLHIIDQEDEIGKEDLALNFDIVPRQIDYYSSALRWIGLVNLKEATLHLTPEGRRIAAMTHAERIKALADIIFREPIFNYAFRHKTGEIPAKLFDRWECRSADTIYRRSQTVRAWIRYFESFVEKL